MHTKDFKNLVPHKVKSVIIYINIINSENGENKVLK